MQRHIRAFLPIALAVAFADFCIATARADEVTDWNQIMFQAALVAKTSPLDMSRNAAGAPSKLRLGGICGLEMQIGSTNPP